MTSHRIIRSIARSLGQARPRTGSRGKRNDRDRFERFTERARKVLSLAQEEAQRLRHNYIGTEHLLLGLVREGDGVAAQVLSNLGVELNRVRSAVEAIIGQGDHPVWGEVGLTPRAKRVIELAVDEARRLNHHYVGTEHLLLGLMREDDGIAVGVLESFGLDLQQVRANTLQVLAAHRPLSSCSFCGKRQDQVQRLIGGPGNIFVCDECVAAFSKASGEIQQQEQGPRCSFCGKKQGQAMHLTLGPHGVNICSECVALCQQIIAEEQPPRD